MADKERFVVKQLIVEDLQFKKVAVTVAAAASSGVSAADPDLVAGSIMGIVPAGNQDQFVDDVTVSATGVITVTLAANATADNDFEVTVWRDDDSYF
jgi:hypothetical protein